MLAVGPLGPQYWWLFAWYELGSHAHHIQTARYFALLGDPLYYSAGSDLGEYDGRGHQEDEGDVGDHTGKAPSTDLSH